MGFIKVERVPLTAAQGEARRSSNKKALLIVAVFAVLFFAWTQDTFDNFLWHVHLNHSDCAQNAFGATFCGDGLKQYEQRLQDAGVNP
jgi:hypothetical protein